MFNQMIEKSIHKSQHCQRNWDLSKEIPEQDLETIKTELHNALVSRTRAFTKLYLYMIEILLIR